MLGSLPKVPYVEDCPDVVLYSLSSRPSRVRLQGVARRLPDGWLYIGRGSSKYGLEPSVWANPFRIGRDGHHDHCMELFRRHLRASPALLARLLELRGKKLACHCGMHEGCHGDVLVQEFAAIAEEHLYNADATSDEDEDGAPKPGLGAGWRGVGPPLSAGVGARARELRDGGGLRSPGRWPPWRRRLHPRAEEVAELLNTILDEAVADYGEDSEVKLESSLACARVEADPLRGLDGRARVALEKLLAKSGFERDGRPNHPGAEVDFDLTAALAKYLGDPDAKLPQKYRLGVRMGYRRRLPSTPAVYPPLVRRWRSPSGPRTTPARGTSKTR